MWHKLNRTGVILLYFFNSLWFASGGAERKKSTWNQWKLSLYCKLYENLAESRDEKFLNESSKFYFTNFLPIAPCSTLSTHPKKTHSAIKILYRLPHSGFLFLSGVYAFIFIIPRNVHIPPLVSLTFRLFSHSLCSL